MEEIAHVRGKVLAIVASSDGNSTFVREVASGVVAIWSLPPDSTTHGEMNYLCTCNTFAYPLIGQPVLRTSALNYVFSVPPNSGDIKNYVLSLESSEAEVGHAESVAFFCESLEKYTTTRVRGGSVATDGGSGAGAVAVTASSTPASASTSTSTSITTASSATPTTATSSAPTSAGVRVSSGIVAMGAVARTVLVAGAGLAGRGVQAASDALAHRLGRAPSGVEISATNRARLGQARILTRTAVVVTASMVEGAVTLARSLSAAAAAAIAETDAGKKLSQSAATPAGVAAKQVAVASLVAFRDVWDGMEEAAITFGVATAGATRTLVTARYGAEALPVANDAIGLATDIGSVVLATRNLSVGGLVRRTAAETATTLLLSNNNNGTMLQVAGQQSATTGRLQQLTDSTTTTTITTAAIPQTAPPRAM